MPKVSVIIPCYNQGQYLDEAVKSVLNQTFQDFEIIIINDGSTDEITNQILQNYNKPKTRVICTINQGLASARNVGIKAAQGEYILPLDADDKIGTTYLEKAVNVLDANPRIGIVYCYAEFFGLKRGKWRLPPYKFPDILLHNMIFCSAFFRKSDWEEVGGYKPIMKYGWEDHEFWLSLIESKKEVYQIPETLFYYRKKRNSMITGLTEERQLYLFEQLYYNHLDLYSENISVLFKKYIETSLVNEATLRVAKWIMVFYKLLKRIIRVS